MHGGLKFFAGRLIIPAPAVQWRYRASGVPKAPTNAPTRSWPSWLRVGSSRPPARQRSWPRMLPTSSASSCTRGPWSDGCRGWEKNVAARRPVLVADRACGAGRTLREYQAGCGKRPGVAVLRVGRASSPGSWGWSARLAGARRGRTRLRPRGSRSAGPASGGRTGTCNAACRRRPRTSRGGSRGSGCGRSLRAGRRT